MLDVGSGTGALAYSISKRNAHCRVIGIDPSNEYAGYANSKNSYADRVRFRFGDAQALQCSRMPHPRAVCRCWCGISFPTERMR
ncbi:MAG: class I SAM-dependent methyltransferase [Acidobacteria bacterium]|nr:class I SAM-dependent methyltransferase [Acidobacteriota bacterium]